MADTDYDPKAPIVFRGNPRSDRAPGMIAQTGAQTGQTKAVTKKLEAQQPFVVPTAKATASRAATEAETRKLELRQKKAAAWLKAQQLGLDAEQTERLVQEMLAMPGLQYVVGSSWSPLHGVFGKRSVSVTDPKTGNVSSAEEPRIPVGGTEANDFMARYNQIMGDVFMRAREPLKSTGTITDYESRKATEAKARMNLATSVPEFKKAAEEYVYYTKKVADRARAAAMGPEEAKKELERRSSSFKILGSRPLGE